MKRSLYLFLISFIITSCLSGGFLGACAAYENTVKIALGEEKRAVYISRQEIRFFDFEYSIK